MLDLTGPCGNCPFRNDERAIELHPDRVPGIQRDLLANDRTPFFCHKTLSGENLEDEDGDEAGYMPGERDQLCGGAAVWLLKRGQPSVMMRMRQVFHPDYFPALKAIADKVID